MSDRPALLGFDVNRIRDYVFAGLRVRDVVGASVLLEEFGRQARRIMADHGATVVYTGGGNGLARCHADQATPLRVALETELSRRTAGGASCAVSWVPDTGRFPEDRQALMHALARAKREDLLDLTPEAALLVDGAARCEGCGLEAATTTDPKAEGEPIGPQCDTRRRTADGLHRSFNLETELFEQAGESSLACVYLDADRAGDAINACGTPEELGRFAETMTKATRRAHDGALAALNLTDRTISPVLGGDDLIVFCDAQHALDLVAALWRHLDAAKAPAITGVRFSAGVSVAPSRTPLRIVYDEAYRALRAAKHAPGDTEHFGLVSLGGRALDDPDQPLLGGPLPREMLVDLRTLLAALDEVPPSQRAGIGADLTEAAHGSIALAELNLAYRAARSIEVGAVVEQAHRIARALDRQVHTVLQGALALGGWNRGRRT